MDLQGSSDSWCVFSILFLVRDNHKTIVPIPCMVARSLGSLHSTIDMGRNQTDQGAPYRFFFLISNWMRRRLVSYHTFVGKTIPVTPLLVFRFNHK